MVGRLVIDAHALIGTIGLMSGTSLDGIDLAFLKTDGESQVQRGASMTITYPDAQRRRLREFLDQVKATPGDLPGGMDSIERDLTLAHVEAVKAFLQRENIKRESVELLGFHGQTVLHRPECGQTLQLGDAELLARETGISVIYDFRSEDMRGGGQGAPLVPLYHAALVESQSKSDVICVVNLGGIANLTWIAPNTPPIAFDIAPCNGLLDDWVARHTGASMDIDGRLAQQGRTDETALASMLSHPFLSKPPPKSLDRLDFTDESLAGLSPADGAATIIAFVAEALAHATTHLPAPPNVWVLCGGGRRNPVLRAALSSRLSGKSITAEEWGWSGDHIEAEAFAWLAVRSTRGLPLTLPSTTGVSNPMCGGRCVTVQNH